LRQLAELLALQIVELRMGPEANPSWRRAQPAQNTAWQMSIPLGDQGEWGVIRLGGRDGMTTAISLQHLATQLKAAVTACIQRSPSGVRARAAMV
jgi:hypothetical protein